MKPYYSPETLAMSDDATLNQLVDAGSIEYSEAVAARMRRRPGGLQDNITRKIAQQQQRESEAVKAEVTAMRETIARVKSLEAKMKG